MLDIETAREMREHLFLTGLSVVVGAGTVALLGAWVIQCARDAIEDFKAGRLGELEPRPLVRESAPVIREDGASEPALECVAGAPDE